MENENNVRRSCCFGFFSNKKGQNIGHEPGTGRSGRPHRRTGRKCGRRWTRRRGRAAAVAAASAASRRGAAAASAASAAWRDGAARWLWRARAGRPAATFRWTAAAAVGRAAGAGGRVCGISTRRPFSGATSAGRRPPCTYTAGNRTEQQAIDR